MKPGRASITIPQARAAARLVKVEKTLGTNPKDLLGMKKVPLHLVPPASLIYQALAMTDGARKYGPYNWRSNKVIATIYVDAAMRHLMAWFDGEEAAEDSGYPHLAHALACLGIIVDAKETGNLVDDRPVPGAAGNLLKLWNQVLSQVVAFKKSQVPAKRGKRKAS